MSTTFGIFHWDFIAIVQHKVVDKREDEEYIFAAFPSLQIENVYVLASISFQTPRVCIRSCVSFGEFSSFANPEAGIFAQSFE